MKKSGDGDDKAELKDLKQATQNEIRIAYWKYIDSIVTTESELEPAGSRGHNMKRIIMGLYKTQKIKKKKKKKKKKKNMSLLVDHMSHRGNLSPRSISLYFG